MQLDGRGLAWPAQALCFITQHYKKILLVKLSDPNVSVFPDSVDSSGGLAAALANCRWVSLFHLPPHHDTGSSQGKNGNTHPIVLCTPHKTQLTLESSNKYMFVNFPLIKEHRTSEGLKSGIHKKKLGNPWKLPKCLWVNTQHLLSRAFQRGRNKQPCLLFPLGQVQYGRRGRERGAGVGWS